MSIARATDQKQNFLYEAVRNDLIEMIRARNLKAHDSLPSEGSIAQTYRVSRMTGKLALKSLEQAGVVYRLDRRGSFLAEGFETRLEALRNQAGQPNRTGPKTVALVIPVVDFYVGDLIKSINQEAARNGLSVLLRVTDENVENEDRILAELSKLPYVQGIILFPADRQDFDGELLRLKLNRYPVVIIDRAYGDVSFDSVYHAHYQGAYDMTSFLINKGHRHIGFASRAMKTTKSREDRYQGYLHALMAFGAPVRKEYIQIVEENVHPDSGVHVLDSGALSVIQAFLTSNREITAVICSDDYVAIELYYAAVGVGLRVPRDLSITGFCDNRVLRFLPIRLSTVSQPVDAMGKQAVACLLSRMNDPEREYCEIVIGTEIVDRDTIRDISDGISTMSE